MIKFIFDPREESSGLAYASLHCVPGLTLPLGDANLFFHQLAQLVWAFEEENDDQRTLVASMKNIVKGRVIPIVMVHRTRTMGPSYVIMGGSQEAAACSDISESSER